MAVADSVGAAWAFSHRHLGQQRSGNWLLQVVPKGQSVEMLQDLDVQTLRIQPETVRTLDRLGVTNIGQLFRLPRSGLATRLGDGLVRRMAQATGEIDEPVDVYHRESDVESKHDLEYPTDDVEILSDRIERLVDDVRAGLATTQRGALGLSCRLDLAAHPPLSFKVGLFAPTLDSKHLSTLLINALQYQRLKSKVTRVSLHVTQRAPMRTNQAFLSESLSDAIHQQKAGRSERNEIRPGKSLGKFNGRSPCRQSDSKATTARETAGLIDTLSARLGRDKVTGIRMTSDPLPENSFRSFPLTGQSRQGITRSAGQTAARPLSPTQRLPSPADVLRRPLVLLSDSLDLDPLYDSPLLSCQSNRRSSAQSLPVKFRLHGTTYVVTQWNGPERIETGWWNGPQHRRDYYRVATDRGQTWWVYRVIARNGTASDLNVGSGSNSRINSRTKPHAANRTEQWRLHGLFS